MSWTLFWLRPPRWEICGLGIEPEQRDVPVGEHIVFALEPIFACLACGRDAAERREILVADDLGLDETLFEIGVNHAGGLRSPPAFLDRPRPHFLFAGGEIRLQPEQCIRAANERRNPG